MEKFEKLLKCKVCEEIFNKPTILGCGHTFCVTCLTGCNSCPECDRNQNRWRRKSKSKIKLLVKWHAGDDIVACFRHDRKDKNKIMAALKDNLKCSICCGFIYKATVTICGHVYCRRCLDTWTGRSHQDCPVCRAHCQPPLTSPPFPWPLGDRLVEELRHDSKRTRTDDSEFEDEVWKMSYPKRPRLSRSPTDNRRRLALVTVPSLLVVALLMSFHYWSI